MVIKTVLTENMQRKAKMLVLRIVRFTEVVFRFPECHRLGTVIIVAIITATIISYSYYSYCYYS